MPEMTETEDAAGDERQMFELPSLPAGGNTGEELRAACQIIAIALGAMAVTVTADFGENGTVNFQALHPDIFDEGEGAETEPDTAAA